MLKAALKYLDDYDWSIIPIWWVNEDGSCGCGSKHTDNPRMIGKHPIVRWAHYQRQKPTRDQIREWWKKWPSANIAVVTGEISDLLVIDDDNKDTVQSRFPKTRSSITGSRGRHYFFQLSGNNYSSGTGVNEKIDVRCNGGYVILPPSKHKSGGIYTWDETSPSTLSEITKDVKVLLASKTASDNTIGKHEEGSRNDAMMREVCALFGKGLAPQEVVEEIRKWNEGWCYPPLADEELCACVKSVWNNKEKPKRLAKRDNNEYKPRVKHPTGHLIIRSSEYMFEKYGGKEQEWIIPGWLPEATCCIISAPPESYKTWIMIDLATSITTGKNFLGKYKVKRRGRVLIAQQEDNFGANIDRTAKVLGMGPPLFNGENEIIKFATNKLPAWTEDRSLHIQNEEAMEELEAYIAKYRPVAIIVDPLFSFLPLSEDYGVEAAQLINSKVKPLRDKYGVSFIFLHHTSKSSGTNESHGSRKRDSMWGSQLLNATIETAWHLRVEKEGGNIIEISRHTKVAGHEPTIKCLVNINDWEYDLRVLGD